MLSNNVNFKSVKWPKIKATGGGGGGGGGVEVNFEILRYVVELDLNFRMLLC